MIGVEKVLDVMTLHDGSSGDGSTRASLVGLQRWIPAILALTVVAFVGTLLVVGPSTTVYSSTATLELTDDVSTLINTKNKATDARREIEAQVRLLGSSENVALLQESMGDQGIELNGLEVLAVENGAVITVTAYAVTAEAARAAAQLAVDTYLESRIALEIEDQNFQLGPLREQREEQLALINELSAEIESIRATAQPSEISILEERTADAIDRLNTYNIAVQEGEFYIQTADGDAGLLTQATMAVPEKSSSLAMAFQVAGLAAIVVSIAAHFIHKSLGPMHLVEEIRAIAGSDRPVLAVIPRFKDSQRDGSNALVVRSDESSPEAEAFRYLRGSIELGVNGQDRYSIAFTSAEQSEGKSVTVSNYAISAARADTDLVLVDADLLNPSIARLFGEQASPGFANLLAGDFKPLDEPTTVPTTGRDLSLITSVQAAGLGRLEFTSESVAAAISKVNTQWSVVALDCPPVLSVSDATTVAAAADHVVFVVRLGRTTKRNFTAALDLLEQSGANLLGIVVTHSKDKSSSYGDYYYVNMPAENT